MHKVEIQTVSPQAIEAGFHSQHDVSPGQAARVHVIASGKVDLGGEDYFVATIGNQFAQDIFGAAAVIDVRRIEKVDPGLPAAAKHGRRCLFVSIAAKRHGSHTQTGNLYTRPSQGVIFHHMTPFFKPVSRTPSEPFDHAPGPLAQGQRAQDVPGA